MCVSSTTAKSFQKLKVYLSCFGALYINKDKVQFVAESERAMFMKKNKAIWLPSSLFLEFFYFVLFLTLNTNSLGQWSTTRKLFEEFWLQSLIPFTFTGCEHDVIWKPIVALSMKVTELMDCLSLFFSEVKLLFLTVLLFSATTDCSTLAFFVLSKWKVSNDTAREGCFPSLSFASR